MQKDENLLFEPFFGFSIDDANMKTKTDSRIRPHICENAQVQIIRVGTPRISGRY